MWCPYLRSVCALCRSLRSTMGGFKSCLQSVKFAEDIRGPTYIPYSYRYITNLAQTNFIWMVPDEEVGTDITNKRIEFKYIYIVILPNREIILPWREDPNGQTCVRWIRPHASCWTDRQWQLAQSRLGRLCCASGFVLIELTGNRIELLGRVPRSQLEYVSRAGP
jgi:hypothetical protein